MKLIRSIACFATLAFAISSVMLFAVAVSSQAQSGPEPKVPLYLGTAWYPEQWPESRWDADLTLMEKAHIRFVRIAEFAWSTMEPSEGHYDLDWVERAIRMAEKHQIAVVSGYSERGAASVVDVEVPGDAAHDGGWPQRRAWKQAAV